VISLILAVDVVSFDLRPVAVFEVAAVEAVLSLLLRGPLPPRADVEGLCSLYPWHGRWAVPSFCEDSILLVPVRGFGFLEDAEQLFALLRDRQRAVELAVWGDSTEEGATGKRDKRAKVR
jgi:hypothetical protein